MKFSSIFVHSKNLFLGLILVLALFLFLVPNHQINATRIEGFSSVTYKNGDTLTFDLKASPPKEDMQGVSFRIKAEGIKILNYSLPKSESWAAASGFCENGLEFTPTEICVALVKSNFIDNDDSLGTVTIFIEDLSKAKLRKFNDSAYSDGLREYEDIGEILNFTSKSTLNSSTVLGISDSVSNDNNEVVVIGIAFLIIVFISISALLATGKFALLKDFIPKIKNSFGLLTVSGLFVTLLFFGYQVSQNNQSVDDSSASIGDITVLDPIASTDYLLNPGIGWQHFPGLGSPLASETVSYAIRQDISWKILNPGDGIYDWSALDNKLNQAIAEGKQFSFRVYTMQGEGLGGHHVPQWVLNKGANLKNGTPNYFNCVYQDEWGKFVDKMRERYDGNPNISYIDISGYGNFNTWGWEDGFTNWDDQWAANYAAGTATASSMSIMDSKSRRRLADIFIGGSFTGHQCESSTGQTQTVNYTYPGFQQTQLVLPYAGIRQNTQYVFTRRKDVGLRIDGLGKTTASEITSAIGTEISQLWKTAPIVFEFDSNSGASYISIADAVLKTFHGSLVHDNLEGTKRNATNIQNLMLNVGYRYLLKDASFTSHLQAGDPIQVDTSWQNIGYAPNYPKMGQQFELTFYLSNISNQTIITSPLETDLTKWLPANPIPGTAPTNNVSKAIPLSSTLPAGTYIAKIAIINKRTNKPVKLSIQGTDTEGVFTLGNIKVDAANNPTQTICGDGVIQTPNTIGVNEICDDGNSTDTDQCSLDCLHSCSNGQNWDGTQCVSPICNAFTFTDWSQCIDGQQTRTVITSSPTSCTGGTPILSQSCSISTKQCYRCTADVGDGNSCESTTINSTDLCPSGYSETSNCALAVGGSCPINTSEEIVCGEVDVIPAAGVKDEKLTIIDLTAYIKVYKTRLDCSDNPSLIQGCGPRDTNKDGKLSIVDLTNFVGTYKLKLDSCLI